MRQIIFLMACMVISFSSCSPKITIVKEIVEEKTNKYSIVNIESFIDCVSNTNYGLIAPANYRMGVIVDSLKIELKDNANKLFASYPEKTRPPYSYELITRDTVFSASLTFISARIEAYTYTGGAHGMTKYYAVNYVPNTTTFLTKADIFDLDQFREIDKVIQSCFVNKDNCFTQKPTIRYASAVNLSNDSVILTYEHYVLGAYTCGATEVIIPRSRLSKFLKI